MDEIVSIGDLVQVAYSPGLLDMEAGFMRYIGMVGIIIDKGIHAGCLVVQFDDGSEVEIPAPCLSRE